MCGDNKSQSVPAVEQPKEKIPKVAKEFQKSKDDIMKFLNSGQDFLLDDYLRDRIAFRSSMNSHRNNLVELYARMEHDMRENLDRMWNSVVWAFASEIINRIEAVEGREVTIEEYQEAYNDGRELAQMAVQKEFDRLNEKFGKSVRM